MKFTELKVWQEAKGLVKKIYTLTENFPKEEQYEMVRRLRKSASIAPTNIAKGAAGITDEEMIYYLGMALKNQAALESEFHIAKDLEFITDKEFETILSEVNDCQKLTYGFMRYFRNKNKEEQTTSTAKRGKTAAIKSKAA